MPQKAKAPTSHRKLMSIKHLLQALQFRRQPKYKLRHRLSSPQVPQMDRSVTRKWPPRCLRRRSLHNSSRSARARLRLIRPMIRVPSHRWRYRPVVSRLSKWRRIHLPLNRRQEFSHSVSHNSWRLTNFPLNRPKLPPRRDCSVRPVNKDKLLWLKTNRFIPQLL